MLESVDRIYRCCANCKIAIHKVQDVQAKELSRNISRLGAALHTTGEEEIWRVFLSRAKKYRFYFSAAPLPLSNQLFAEAAEYRRLENIVDRIPSSGESSVRELAGGILEGIRIMHEKDENRLLTRFEEICTDVTLSADHAVVLINQDLVRAVKQHFDKQPKYAGMDVLSPHDIKNGGVWRRMFIFGAPGWYIGRGYTFLVSAPRADRIEFISYDWINNRVEVKPAFDCLQPTGKNAPVMPEPYETTGRQKEVLELEEADMLLPVLDVNSLKKRLDRLGGLGRDEEEEIVNARIVLLSGKKAVYVEWDEGASSFVLSLSGMDEDSYGNDGVGEDEDEDDSSKRDGADSGQGGLFGRCANMELKEGMFLLLRTGGGGDYVVTVADKILGSHRAQCRSMQKQWKTAFRNLLNGKGTKETKQLLRSHGGTDVHEMTLRNWVRERNIRPGSDKNFKAVLQITGLSSDDEKYMKNAEMILTAHRQAGGHIRKLLLDQIGKKDIKQLKESGTMVFQLPGIDTGASMTAFRIEQVLQENLRVPAHRLHHPVDVGEDLWR